MLTGARYAVIIIIIITTAADAGVARDFVTAGFTSDEHRAMEAWPD